MSINAIYGGALIKAEHFEKKTAELEELVENLRNYNKTLTIRLDESIEAHNKLKPLEQHIITLNRHIKNLEAYHDTH